MCGKQPEELERIEALVNGWVQASHALETRVVPLAEAKAAGGGPLCPVCPSAIEGFSFGVGGEGCACVCRGDEAGVCVCKCGGGDRGMCVRVLVSAHACLPACTRIKRHRLTPFQISPFDQRSRVAALSPHTD